MLARFPTVAPQANLCKVVLDRVVAGLLLVLAVPVIALAALLIRLSGRGPAFYRQTRLGKDGKPFELYKLRTMHVDSEKDGPRWSLPGDTRVTWMGQFLRRTHLDELPQLWNVLRGDMSLIGPRPERPEFIPRLAAALPCYRDRLAVLPGVTGLAQVQQPADTDLDSVRSKLAYDLWYVRNRSLWLDARLVAATAIKLFGVSFVATRVLLWLPTPDVVCVYYAELTRGAAPAKQAAPAIAAEWMSPLPISTLWEPQ